MKTEDFIELDKYRRDLVEVLDYKTLEVARLLNKPDITSQSRHLYLSELGQLAIQEYAVLQLVVNNAKLIERLQTEKAIAVEQARAESAKADAERLTPPAPAEGGESIVEVIQPGETAIRRVPAGKKKKS